MDERSRNGVTPGEGFVAVPTRACDEIGALAYYLEQSLHSLRDITEHLRGSSGHMPSVLDDLRDVVKMTEAATVRVLEETEALVDDGRTAARLIEDVHAKASAGDVAAVSKPIKELGALVERSNARAMSIMSALEFQDLTSQKVERTFGVLQEVVVRLGKIQDLVSSGRDEREPVVARSSRARISPDSTEGQKLADELLLNLTDKTDR
jgi:chemotaxis regulatin CheY-phosphate phosphatase CheZ